MVIVSAAEAWMLDDGTEIRFKCPAKTIHGLYWFPYVLFSNLNPRCQLTFRTKRVRAILFNHADYNYFS